MAKIMSKLLKFEEFSINENIERYSLTDKYSEIEDQLFCDTDEEFEALPMHLKVLSIFTGIVDGALMTSFDLYDDTILNAVNKESDITNFIINKEELEQACAQLKEEGYLK